jgi:hypothetical protein
MGHTDSLQDEQRPTELGPRRGAGRANPSPTANRSSRADAPLTQPVEGLAYWHTQQMDRLGRVRPDGGLRCCPRLRRWSDRFDDSAVARF